MKRFSIQNWGQMWVPMIPCKPPLQEGFLRPKKPLHSPQLLPRHLLLNNSANLLAHHHRGHHHRGHRHRGHRPQVLLLALRQDPRGRLHQIRHRGRPLNLQDHQDPHQVEVVE